MMPGQGGEPFLPPFHSLHARLPFRTGRKMVYPSDEWRTDRTMSFPRGGCHALSIEWRTDRTMSFPRGGCLALSICIPAQSENATTAAKAINCRIVNRMRGSLMSETSVSRRF
jgi:hypothetical protein